MERAGCRSYRSSGVAGIAGIANAEKPGRAYIRNTALICYDSKPIPKHDKTSKNLQRFDSMAKGPLTHDLGYGDTADMEVLLEEVSKLLVAYASAIDSNRRASH